MLYTETLGFLLPALGFLTNIDRVVEIAEGAALVTTAIGLTRPSVARKIAKVDEEIDEVLESAEVATGLEMVRAIEDGVLTGDEILEKGTKTLVMQKREKKSLRSMRRSRLDR